MSGDSANCMVTRILTWHRDRTAAPRCAGEPANFYFANYSGARSRLRGSASRLPPTPCPLHHSPAPQRAPQPSPPPGSTRAAASFTQRRAVPAGPRCKVARGAAARPESTGGRGRGARATHRVTVRLGSVSGGRTCASSRLLHTTLPSAAPAALPATRGRPSCLQPGGSAVAPRPPPSSASSAIGSSSGGGGRPRRRPGGSMLRGRGLRTERAALA